MMFDLRLALPVQRFAAVVTLALAMFAAMLVPNAALPDRAGSAIEWVVPDAVQEALGISDADAGFWGTAWDYTKRTASTVGSAVWTGASAGGAVVYTASTFTYASTYYFTASRGLAGAAAASVAVSSLPVAAAFAIGGAVYGGYNAWTSWGS